LDTWAWLNVSLSTGVSSTAIAMADAGMPPDPAAAAGARQPRNATARRAITSRGTRMRSADVISSLTPIGLEVPTSL
jgi:hypothetical protein